MKKINIFLLVVILSFMAILLTSCETLVVHQRPGWGPPAHAPAHGVRNKQPKTIVLVDVDN